MQAPKLAIEKNSQPNILEKIAAGEKSAVEECIRTYSCLVWKIARKYMNNTEDAEDAVQEIFTSIWLNAHRFDAEKSPESAFICLLAQRKAIDLLRRKRYLFLETELPATDGSENSAHGDYRSILLNIDLKPIFKALKDLPEKEIELIKLSVFGGNSHHEIAEISQMPLGTVKSKIRRGLNKVRSSVGKPFLADLQKAYYG